MIEKEGNSDAENNTTSQLEYLKRLKQQKELSFDDLVVAYESRDLNILSAGILYDAEIDTIGEDLAIKTAKVDRILRIEVWKQYHISVEDRNRFTEYLKRTNNIDVIEFSQSNIKG